jgi:chromosomal replication initiation ATPase DnaA
MAQMVLNFPLREDFGAARFFPTAGSAAARELLENFEQGILCLWGEAGSGKTHLLNIWRAKHDKGVGEGNFLAVDDLDKVDAVGQEQLFHWLNNQGKTGALVVASRQPVVELQGLLPDVRSRLSAGQAVEVLPPSDDELAQVAAKWAAERQLELSPEVINFILARAERSVPALRTLVAKLDRLSLEEKRGVTVPLAKKALGF